MPKNAAIIGRVAVKVIPDTTDFRGDAQRELDGVEKELKPIEVTVNPKVDLNQLVSEINHAHDIAQAAMRDITLHVNVDTRNIGNGMNNVNNDLANLDQVHRIQVDGGTSEIKVEVDQGSKNKALAELAALRDQVKNIDCHINVDIDSVSKDKTLAELKTLNAEVHDVKAEIKFDVNQISKAKADAEIAVLTRPRDVPIRANVDKGSLSQVMNLVGMFSGGRVYAMKVRGVAELASQLDTLAPKFATVSLGAMGMVSSLLASTSSLFSIAGELAAISGLMVAVPGVFAGVAIGLGITMLALKDMKKALPDVYAEWQNIKNDLTKDFWSQASGGIRNLANLYLPQLGNTAKSVGKFWGMFADALAKPLGASLPGMFANLNGSIAIAAFHTDSFAGIISKLGTIGAAQLPRLAAFVGDISDKFNQWLNVNLANGQLQAFIDIGIQALKDLGNVLHQAGRIFMGVVQAANAGGGAILGTLGDGLKKIADTVNSPAFQKGLAGVFQAAHDAISNLTSTAGPAFKTMLLTVGTTLQAILPMVGTAIGTLVSGLSQALSNPVLQEGLVSMFSGISQAVIALSPAFNALGQALGLLAPLFGQFALSLAPIFEGAMKAMAPIMAALVPVISSLITIFGGAFQQVMLALEPVIVAVVQAFAMFMQGVGLQQIAQLVSVMVPLLQTLAGAFLTVFSTVMDSAGPVFGQLISNLVNLAAAIVPVVTQMVTAFMPVIPVIAQAITTLLAALGPLIVILVNSLAPIIPVIASLFAQLAPVIAQIGATLAGSLASILPIIANLFITLVSAIGPVIPILLGALAPILPMIAQTIGMIVTAITPLIPALVKLLMAVIMPLVPLFLQLVQSVLLPLAPIITNLVTSLLPFINALTQIAMVIMPILVPILTMLANILIGAVMGAINGVVNMFTGFMDILTGVWDIVSGIFTGNWSKIWNGIKEVFQGVFEFIGGLIEFIWNVVILATFMDGLGFIKDLWEAVWGGIKTVFKDCFGFVGDLVKTIWDAIKSIWKDGIQGIKDAWNAVWNWVKDFFSGIWKGVSDGIWDGITHVVGFFKDLPGKVMDAVGSLLDKLASFGGNLLTGLWNGLKGASSWLLQKIGDFFGDLLPGWVKSILGIHSPSKVFAEIGSWLLPGLAQGMVSDPSLNTVKDAVSVMHDAVTTTIDTGLLYDSGALLSSGLLDGMESQYGAIRDSLKGLGSDLAQTDVNPVVSGGVAAKVSSVAGSAAAVTAGGNTLIYNAAPNSSVDSAEDLFAAATRARMGW